MILVHITRRAALEARLHHLLDRRREAGHAVQTATSRIAAKRAIVIQLDDQIAELHERLRDADHLSRCE